jgi:hypothetical protein
VSSVLIVESKNDQVFVEALVKHLNLANIELDAPLCQIDEYECLNGLSRKRLIAALDSLKYDLITDDIQAIGIILDSDGRQAERLELINNAVREVFATSEQFLDAGELITVSVRADDDDINLQLACFLTNVDGQGELETVLRAIKNQPAVYADCLDEWRRCLEEHGKTISDKELDKFWVNNYIRFDTCSKKEKKQAYRKCSMQNFDYIMQHKKNIWNFDSPVLDEFKSFLRLFNASSL